MNRIENFSKAWQEFIADPHVDHASYTMTILDGKTGSILFEHAKDTGLAPASSMKTICAAAALHYLGPDFTYETLLQYLGEIDPDTGFLDGFIYIVGSGDPSLGSWRYDETVTGDFIIKKWVEAIKKAGIKKCRGVIGDNSRWNVKQMIISDGWAWNDIGHWYGTGCSALNWRENEFIIEVEPGASENTPARIVTIKNPPPHLEIINELRTSLLEEEPTLYFSIDGSNSSFLRGNVSLDPTFDFSLHCAVPNSALYVADELTQALRKNGIEIEQEASVSSTENDEKITLDIHQSPPLSKLLEQFLVISINMYGEVFIRTIADQTKMSSIKDAPLTVLSSYIKTLPIDQKFLTGVALTDGSGLARNNRLTSYILAQILYRVQNESWFEDVFHNAFPTINGLRMKSGTLQNTIAYAGYVRENSLVFSFMINNYYGDTPPDMRKKVWRVLDTLK